MNDLDRRLWVLVDEELYEMFLVEQARRLREDITSRPLTVRKYVMKSRAAIDEIIEEKKLLSKGEA